MEERLEKTRYQPKVHPLDTRDIAAHQIASTLYVNKHDA